MELKAVTVFILMLSGVIHLCFITDVTGRTDVRLAFLGPDNSLGNEWESAFKLSVELMNEIAIRNGSNFTFTEVIHRTTKIPSNCNMSDLVTTLLKSKVAGVVGPAYSDCAVSLSKGLLGSNLTQISYSATAEALSNKTLHPNFYRICPGDHAQAKALGSIIKHYWGNKTNINVVKDGGLYSNGLTEAFIKEVEGIPVTVYPVHNVSDVESTIYQIQNSSSRVTVVLTNTGFAEKIFVKANEKGLFTKGNYWIGSDSVLNINTSTALKDVFQGLVVVSPIGGGSRSATYLSLLSRWLTKSQSLFPGRIWDSEFEVQVSAYVPHVYDVVFAYYKALSNIDNPDNRSQVLREQIKKKLKTMDDPSSAFINALGVPIFFDSITQSGPQVYSILNLQDPDNWEKVGIFNNEKLTMHRSIIWSGMNLDTSYSPTSPEQITDDSEYKHLAIVLGILLGIFVILTIAMYQFVQTYKMNAENGHVLKHHNRPNLMTEDYIQENSGAFLQSSSEGSPLTYFDEERKVEVTHL